MAVPLTDAERTAYLDREIVHLVRLGYQVTARTPFTAQLVRPKRFDAGLAILGLLFFVVGLLIYLLAYMARQDETAYLAVDERGTVTQATNTPLWLPSEPKSRAAG